MKDAEENTTYKAVSALFKEADTTTTPQQTSSNVGQSLRQEIGQVLLSSLAHQLVKDTLICFALAPAKAMRPLMASTDTTVIPDSQPAIVNSTSDMEKEAENTEDRKS